jgi:hypothetical protein
VAKVELAAGLWARGAGPAPDLIFSA